MLFCTTSGQGPDLVLLHGWAMNSDVWDDLLPQLEPLFRVTRVDLPGHGRSLDCPQDYTLHGLATQLATVLPQQAHLLGWSLGGMLATQFTLDFPQRVHSLALVASSPQFIRSHDWPDGVDSEILDGFASGLQQDFQQMIKRFIAIQTLGSEHARDQQRRLRERILRHGDPQPAALGAGLDILRHANLRTRLADITCPSLLIAGQHDALFRRPAAEQTQALFSDNSNVQLSVIPRAGHAPFLSHPKDFLDSLLPFLT